jgi:hypothetical protein
MHAPRTVATATQIPHHDIRQSTGTDNMDGAGRERVHRGAVVGAKK